METAVRFLLSALGLYAVAGALFAVVFHAHGIKHVDHAVEGASIGFRLLITPALIALWPLMWKRWRVGDGSWLGKQDQPVTARRLRERHGLLIVLVLVVVLVLAIPALIYRPGQPIQHGNVPLITGP